MLTKFSVKKPYVIAVIVLIILVLGIVSVINTDVDFLPEMDLPYIVVATVYAGQPAEVVESDVTCVLESSLSTMSAVKSATSMSYDNVSVISLSLQSGADVDKVAEEVRTRVDGAALPDSDYLQESMIIKANPNMLPAMTVSVSRSNESVPDNIAYFNKLADRIKAVEGVQDVTVSGLIDNYVTVNLSREKIASSMQKSGATIINGQTQYDSVNSFMLSVRKNLSGLLKQTEDSLSSAIEGDVSSYMLAAQNIVKFYSAVDEYLSDKDGSFTRDFASADKNDRNAINSVAATKVSALLKTPEFSNSPAVLAVVSAYPTVEDFTAVHINRLLITDTEGEYENLFAEIVAAAAKTDYSGVYHQTLINMLSDAFNPIFAYIADADNTGEFDADLMAAGASDPQSATAEQIATAVGKKTQQSLSARPVYASLNSYIATVGYTEFAYDIADYLVPASDGAVTYDKIKSAAISKYVDSSSLSTIEQAVCAQLGYEDFSQLFAALASDETAQLYVDLTQSLTDVINSELITQLLKAQDISLPSGSYTENGITYIINVDGSVSSLGDLVFMPATGINVLSLLSSAMNSLAQSTYNPLYTLAFSILSNMDIEDLNNTYLIDFIGRLLNNDTDNFTGWDELQSLFNLTANQINSLKTFAAKLTVTPGDSVSSFFVDAGWASYDESKPEKSRFIMIPGNIRSFTDGMSELTVQLYLNDIADISVIDTSAIVYSKLDGLNSISLSITKQSGYSGAKLSDNLNALFKELTQSEEFADLQYLVLYDDGNYTNSLISTVVQNLLWGALLAVVILFLFLKDLRPTLLTAASMAVSVLATFVIMYFAGITLNLMSMAGLALGIGMLVDNSVVVMENIYRLRARGVTAKEAALQGTSQLSGAILASTITSLIVWLPLVFTEGLTKTVVKDMAVTLCLSLFVSFVVALTLVPAVAQYTAANFRPKKQRVMNKVKEAYGKSLSFTLKHKWITSAVVVVMLALAVTSFFFMDVRFFPETDTGSITVEVTPDAAAINKDNLDYSDVLNTVTGELNNYLSAVPEVSNVSIAVSRKVNIAGYTIEYEQMDISTDSISAVIKLHDDRRRSAKSLCDDLVDELSDGNTFTYAGYYKVKCSTGTVIDTAVASDNLTVNVYGDDLTALKDTVSSLSSILSQVEGVSYVTNNVGGSGVTYELSIDKEKAIRYNLTVGEVYQQIAKYLSNVKLSPATSFTVSENNEDTSYKVLVYDYFYTLRTWHKGYNGENETNIYYKDEYSLHDGVTQTQRNFYLLSEDGSVTPLTPATDSQGYVRDERGFIKLTDSSGRVYYADDSEEYYADKRTYGNITDMEISYTLNGHIGGTQSGTIALKELLTDGSYTVTPEGEVILESKEGMVSIDRRDGRRYSAITLSLRSDASRNKVEKDVNKLLKTYLEQDKVNGVSVEFLTQTAEVDEIYTTLYIVLGVAIVLIYLVMVAQFGSLKTPFIIMFTIPLAFTGSLLALFITGVGISVVALLGIIMLMGVVVNNGIVFVDLCNKLVAAGMPKHDAVIAAGKTRLRPILITALTTIVGLIITACDFSATGKMLQPMAITTIGGLLYSTILTLFFIPVMYDLLTRKSPRMRKRDQLQEDVNAYCDEETLSLLDETCLENILPQSLRNAETGVATMQGSGACTEACDHQSDCGTNNDVSALSLCDEDKKLPEEATSDSDSCSETNSTVHEDGISHGADEDTVNGEKTTGTKRKRRKKQ